MPNTLRYLWLLGGLLTGCRDKPSYEAVPLVLLAPATFTPSRATMQLGDTLWLDINCPDSLLDWQSGRRYRVRPQDLALAPGLAIKKLQGIGQLPTGAASTFRVVERVGTMSLAGTTGVFSLAYDGQAYRARFGLLPTQVGVTSISLLLSPAGGSHELGKILPFIQLPPDAQGLEQRAVLDDLFFVINGGQTNNYDLYGRYATTYPDALPKSKLYAQQSTFTVEVR